MEPSLDFEFIGKEVIGNDFSFETPFGTRLMTYADFVASGRSLRFIEKFLLHIQRCYANTHTEDNLLGRTMTNFIEEAEERIKKSFNAQDNCYIFAQGTGATGSISKLQEMLGLYVPPATKDWAENTIKEFGNANPADREAIERLVSFMRKKTPVVFIGPYEHHSNDIMWRESPAEVVEVELNDNNELDLQDLENKVSDPKYAKRLKIGSFSACSNITGLLSPVHDIARILHKHNAIACFDFAASAPYINIDMNNDDESYFDAIFISPHKFIGGPGSSGVLILNKNLYRHDLAPTRAAGGTVDYVGPVGYDFIKAPETREKAGTPGALQIIKAALCIDIKNAVGIENIESKENEYKFRAFERLTKNPNIEIIGPTDPDKRIPIFSLLFKHKDRYIHHKLGTGLLNDLFGIQTRAGCSCAGPYGHRLLDIGNEKSARYRAAVQKGFLSVKPGWVRLNFHYIMTENCFNFICDAVDFVADYGYLFLQKYEMDRYSGTWRHIGYQDPVVCQELSVNAILGSNMTYQFEKQDTNRMKDFRRYLDEAERIAEQLKASQDEEYIPFEDPEIEALSFFYVKHFMDEGEACRPLL